ncbi:MAG: ATP-dependent Zn protease [Symploca sp. SIO3E6]|nr:ATP-dependent Zn protease [Caldora sp. SIO3E6]
MQQAALNLIAIGVFCMTLSVLLGPMLNIPAAIPALATMGVLSLATLDTLGFQGKGVTILLDLVAGTKSQYRDRILHHEAGHFLVAYLLDIPITGYTLTAWEAFKQGKPGLGGVTFDTQGLSPDPLAAGEVRLTLERFCTVWMAGIAAETLVYDSAEGGAEDQQKLREALTTLGLPTNQYSLKERWATRQAQGMIEENLSAYQALVEAMKQRASVTECSEVIAKAERGFKPN